MEKPYLIKVKYALHSVISGNVSFAFFEKEITDTKQAASMVASAIITNGFFIDGPESRTITAPHRVWEVTVSEVKDE